MMTSQMSRKSSTIIYAVFIAVVITGLFKTAFPCSPSPHRPYRSIVDLSILAPVVIVGRVVNISVDSSSQAYIDYSACLLVEEVIKGDRPSIPQRFCTKNFGPGSMCLAHVDPGNSYVFFLNTDLKARYDSDFSAVVPATNATIALARHGYCNSSVNNSSCDNPVITDAPNEMIVVEERAFLALKCHVLGNKPFVVIWYFKGGIRDMPGSSILTSYGDLIMRDVTSSYQGRYTCVVKNAAGVTSQDKHIIVESKRCGKSMMVTKRSHIYTPNFPGEYPPDKWCTWRLCPPTTKRIKFVFNKFDLQRYDSFIIENECERSQEPWRTYCGIESPGDFVSYCKSGCVQLRLFSKIKFGYTPNYFRGMNITVEPITGKRTPKFDVLKEYCNSDFAFKGRFIDWAERGLLTSIIRIHALESFKKPFDTNGTYTLETSGTNGYGCYENFNYENDHYFLGIITDGRFKIKTTVPDDNQKKATVFQKKLAQYKDIDDPCRPQK